MSAIYVGYTTLTLPGWERFAPEVKVPANYKDPIKIAAFIEEAKKRQAAEASMQVLTGAIGDLAVSDSKGETHKMTAQEFIKLFPDPGNCLVCYKPLNLLRFVVAQLVVEGKTPPVWAVRSETFGTALLDGGDTVRVIDPIRALIGHNADDAANLRAVVQRFNLDGKANPGAEWLAVLAMKAGNLIGV
jgi:hypothetical protein